MGLAGTRWHLLSPCLPSLVGGWCVDLIGPGQIGISPSWIGTKLI